jgi:hypothetical protein
MNDEEEVLYLKLSLYKVLMRKMYAKTISDIELHIVYYLTADPSIKEYITKNLKELEKLDAEKERSFS